MKVEVKVEAESVRESEVNVSRKNVFEQKKCCNFNPLQIAIVSSYSTI